MKTLIVIRSRSSIKGGDICPTVQIPTILFNFPTFQPISPYNVWVRIEKRLSWYYFKGSFSCCKAWPCIRSMSRATLTPRTNCHHIADSWWQSKDNEPANKTKLTLNWFEPISDSIIEYRNKDNQLSANSLKLVPVASQSYRSKDDKPIKQNSLSIGFNPELNHEQEKHNTQLNSIWTNLLLKPLAVT